MDKKIRQAAVFEVGCRLQRRGARASRRGVICVSATLRPCVESPDDSPAAGTSLEVAPASNLPALALGHGTEVILVNRQRTSVDGRATVVIHDDVTRVLPAMLLALTGEGA